jgi:peptidoglycan/xylan/chitin deacetylase (PgdA/CDA1 family)
VALTFDDGPDAVSTPKILAALEEADAVATFFVIGDRAAREPELLREVIGRGHALGTHSLVHAHPAYSDAQLRALVADYRESREIVETAVRQQIQLFRPPYGYIDVRVGLAARVARFAPWLWSVSAQDWSDGATASSVVEATCTLAGGDVVLLHDGLVSPPGSVGVDRSATIAAVPAIVERVRRRGLRLVTLPCGRV